MSSHKRLIRQRDEMGGQLAAARKSAEFHASAAMYLSAVVKVQAAEIARLRVKLTAGRWPWHRRLAVKLRRVLRLR